MEIPVQTMQGRLRGMDGGDLGSLRAYGCERFPGQPWLTHGTYPNSHMEVLRETSYDIYGPQYYVTV